MEDNQCYLEILAEEAAEVIQAKSKIARFGLHDYHPKNKMPNQQKLGMEIGNFMTMVGILLEEGIVLSEDISRGKQQKQEKLKKWMCQKNE